MAIFEDGTGAGYTAKIDSKNRLYVDAITQTAEHYANTISGQAYHIVVEETATGTNDVIFYLQNTSTNNNIIIEGFDYRVASAETIEIYRNPLGTTAGGTAVLPVNANTSSAKTLSATVESGSDITGLTNGQLLDRIFLTSTESSNFNFNVDFVIAPGGSFSLRAVTGSVQVNLTIQCYEEGTV